MSRTVTILTMTVLLACVSADRAPAQRTDEDRRLDRAFALMRAGDPEAAEPILRRVNEADENAWRSLHGLPPGHWVAESYLAAIERMRAGRTTDAYFATDRFRFHLNGVTLEASERERIGRAFEEVLERVATWAGRREEWLGPNSRIVFVEIAADFPTPSPARTLIFLWDRQDRAPRMEVTERALRPDFLVPILAHELTHVVLPHTVRPLAEGMANLAARELYPDRPIPIRSRVSPDARPWPLDEVLRFDVAATGRKAKRQIELLREGGFGREAIELTGLMYRHGDDLVGMILDRWGRDRLMELYDATNGDPAAIDVTAVVEEHLGPMEEVRALWDERVGR